VNIVSLGSRELFFWIAFLSRKDVSVTWKNIDWLNVQLWEYDTTVNDRVREVYLAAHKTLEKAFCARKSRHDEAIAKAKDEADAETAIQELMYAESRWEEQKQALAAMALSLLASVDKSFLDQIKGMFDQKHPPDAAGYAGNGHLRRQIAEYKARFNVDLEKINGFETIREAELARHCCVHNGGVPSADYLQQTKARLIGQDDRINTTPEILDVFIVELANFARELCSQMKALR